MGCPAGEEHDAPAGTPGHVALQINGRWQEAADAWQALGRPYERALALIEVSTPPALTEAFDVLDRLGAGPAAALVAERLRSLGERVPRGVRPSTRANPAGLTAREIEVLQLVVDGLTNGEIAAKLFVSDKTVEHHVSRILVKLGVTSRREAARTAHQLDLAIPATRPSLGITVPDNDPRWCGVSRAGPWRGGYPQRRVIHRPCPIDCIR